MSDYAENARQDGAPIEEAIHEGDDPVLVFSAATEEEAEIVRATLAAAGIPAFLQKASVNPMLGAIDGVVDGAWMNGVFVSTSHAMEARGILESAPMTDEDFNAAAEADPTTLEEAEERARHAP